MTRTVTFTGLDLDKYNVFDGIKLKYIGSLKNKECSCVWGTMCKSRSKESDCKHIRKAETQKKRILGIKIK